MIKVSKSTIFAIFLGAAIIVIAKAADAFEVKSGKDQKTTAAAPGGESQATAGFKDCPQCPEMAIAPAGSFIMGANGRFKNERPAHKVIISHSFAIGKYEVTFDEWEACVKDEGCKNNPDDHKWGRGKRPVVNIKFDEAKEYVQWLSKKTGQKYRLPSEAEWEYAARAKTQTEYWWGDEVGAANANCRTCAPDISHETLPVGTYKPNPFGLFDVHGNVWEWVEDCWNENHDNAPADGRARLDGDCQYRVNKSGSWYYVSTNVRSAYRAKFPAAAYSYGIGLRVLREIK